MWLYFFKDNSFHYSYAVLQLQDINLSVNVLKNWTPPPLIYLNEYTNTPTGPKEAPPLQKETFIITSQTQKHFFFCVPKQKKHFILRQEEFTVQFH